MVQTPDKENYFSFKRMNTTHQATVPHFQLRNLMASTSRNNIFYADRDVVLRTDAAGSGKEIAMDLRKEMTEVGKFQVTTLAASEHVLIAGGFEGEYALLGLSDSPNKRTTVGRIKDRSRDSKSHITNHIHLFNSRTNYTPQAVLSSNDNRLRILDCNTNTFTHSFGYSQAVNCSSTSPNGRMRVVVGDFRETYITNAETGQPFETLKTHTDDAFACDWADDGIHVATAAQDSTIVVWDARFWARPLKVLYSELSIPRCLKFSPVGGGPRVLVSAEADDYLNVINAQTFESKQVFDFFGRTAGISMTSDGSSLFLANSEPHFGGIMEFERCGFGERTRVTRWDDDGKRDSGMSDWDTEEGLDADWRTVCSKNERRRRGVDLGALAV
jgi:DNA-binding beta-propeller fold protein YncE